jgi:hypothetical protein
MFSKKLACVVPLMILSYIHADAVALFYILDLNDEIPQLKVMCKSTSLQ